MAIFRGIRGNRRFVTPDQNNPLEQARYFECFQCACMRFNPNRGEDEPRFKCTILDSENKVITLENENIINPDMRKPLKRCVNHPEVEPEEVFE